MAEPASLEALMKAPPAAKPADKPAVTPASVPAATPAAPPGSRTLFGWVAASVTKKQLAVGASAIFSLVAGIAAVRLIWPTPAEEEKTPPATAQLLASEPKPTLGPPSTTLPPDPAERLGPQSLPTYPVPAVSPGAVVPAAGPSSWPATTGTVPSPPTVDIYRTPDPVPAAPSGGATPPPLPTYPMAGSPPPPADLSTNHMPSAPVVPAGGTVMPPTTGTPPTAGMPPTNGTLPTPPPGPGAGPIPLPALPTTLPETGGTLPLLPAGPSASPPTAGPKLPPPDPLDFGASSPKPPPPATVPGLPVAPSTPSTPGAGGLPPVPPTDLSASPSAPLLPSAGPGSGSGARLEYTKPPNTPTVSPVANSERTPTTSYDVDIYEAKSGDTWEAISREFYSDTKYAAALRAYNLNKVLQTKTSVDVPPIHVLRRASPQPSAVVPASRTGTTADPWAPAGTGASGAGNTYRVPRGGTSLQAVARSLLKNEQRWRELYELNPHIADAALVPEGTEIKLPSDTRGQ